MDIGPVDIVVVGFDNDDFHGELATNLADLVESGLIHIIDLVFVRKDEDGTVAAIEVDNLDKRLADAYADLDGESGGLLSDADLDFITADVPAGTSCGLLVYENVWARKLASSLRDAGGFVLFQDRIPAPEVEAAFAALAQ